MEDIKPLDLPLPDFDPPKFDQAGFLRDVSALEKQGLFETIETDNQLRDILAGLFAKNYGNGEHLFVLSAIRENRDHLQKLAHELDRAIARKEGEDEGRRQGVESAANLQGVLAEIAGMKAQGAELKKDVAAVGQGVKDAAREGAKKAVETTLPKEYAKAANMSDDELREANKPKTRSHGGGRKKERDLDDAQVKAVLADMKKHKRESLRAYCDYIIKTMKDGMYQNPYEKAKDLDAAVRRYCKKNGIPLVVKARTGRWSAKK